jgi:hypothetical protein
VSVEAGGLSKSRVVGRFRRSLLRRAGEVSFPS